MLLFGLGAIVWPHITLIALVFLFGAFVLLDGIFAAIVALVERRLYRHWWIILLEGLVGVAVGVITFFLPHVTALVLLYLIAVWAFVTGVFKIVASIQLRKIMKTDWLLIVSGIASLIFGVLLAIQPAAGAMALDDRSLCDYPWRVPALPCFLAQTTVNRLRGYMRACT